MQALNLSVLMNRILLLLILVCCTSATTVKAQVPYQVVTQDGLNFWRAYDALVPGVDTVTVFETKVIEPATPQFTAFIRKNKITAKQYAAQVKAFPKFYRTIRESSIRLLQSESTIRSLVQKLKDMY